MDYYETLGVSRNASQTEIRNAYRRLAKQYHPDRNASEHAKTYIQLINEAYETLSDSAKRGRYDQPSAFTFVVEETPQADPREAQRRENFNHWQERERVKREEETAYKHYVFAQFKKINRAIVLWALLLVVDEYILPPRVSNEAVLEARSVTSGRRGYQLNFIAQTKTYIMAVPIIAVEKSNGTTLTIEASRLLNIPLRVITFDGSAYQVGRTVLAFIAPIPLFLLIAAMSLYWIREPNNLATLAMSVEGICIVTMAALWLITITDRNAF